MSNLKVGSNLIETSEREAELIPSDWTTRQVVLGTLVVILVVVGFLLIYTFRQMAVISFSGVVISMAIAPAVDWLNQHRLSRALSVILIYLILLVLLISFVLLMLEKVYRGSQLPA